MSSPVRPDVHAVEFQECFGRLRDELARVFVGQTHVLDELLLCFFCQGHGLLEGAPGVGKTLDRKSTRLNSSH